MPLDRRRGHAADASACWTGTGCRGADDQLPRPERAGPARCAAGPPARRRGPGARHRRRHAGRQRPRRRPRRGLGGGGRAGRADPRRLGRARRGGRVGGDRPALVVRGVPAAVRARAKGPARRDRRRRPRVRRCSRRPGGSRPRSGTLPRPAARAGPGRSAGSSPRSTSRSCAGRSASWPRPPRMARSRPRRVRARRRDACRARWIGSGRDRRRPRAEVALEAARAQVQELVEAGTPRGEAAKRVAAASGLPRRQLYEVTERS